MQGLKPRKDIILIQCAAGKSCNIASYPFFTRCTIATGMIRYLLDDCAHRTIERFCLEAGIPVFDLRAVLGSRPTESLWVHPVDRHPNDVAHRLVGESLAPVVRDLLR